MVCIAGSLWATEILSNCTTYKVDLQGRAVAPGLPYSLQGREVAQGLPYSLQGRAVAQKALAARHL